MTKYAKISVSLLFGLLLALPATMLTSQPAQAQAQHKLEGQRRQTSGRHAPNSKRTTTTKSSGTHVRNVRPNPNRPQGHRPPAHRPAPSRPVVRPRPSVYVPPHRPPVYHTRHHRSRVHTRYHHNRVVVHHHYVTPAPRVVIVEVDRPQLPELSCPIHTYSRQNQLEQWCETSRGVRHGPYVRRHSNGQISMEGEYEYDQREGLWTEWHANGEPRLEGEYVNGERVGLWIRWDQNGREVSAIEYR